MGINANVSGGQQITASVGETKIDVAVSGGVGPSGASGTPGAAASITVGTVTTGAPGSSASVVNAGTSSAAVLNFTIPAGATGATGPQGPAGPAGTTTWAGITDRPSTFPPSSHQHVAADISDFTSAVIAAAPPTVDASLLTQGTLPDQRLSSNIARTSDVSAAVAAVVGAAPAALDTLNELAAALGNDASFSATVTNSLASKAPINNPTFTGTVNAFTVAASNIVTALSFVRSTGLRVHSSTSGANFDGFPTFQVDFDGVVRAGQWQGTTIAVAHGGTGATTAAGALTNLGAVATSDARLTDAREWSAATIDQAEAETGTATTRRAFTAQRVFQAIAAWWNASAAKTKLDGIATGATANATDAQLRDRATHTGTQAASTISNFSNAAAAAAPVQSVAGRFGAVTLAKGDVGLGNVDNTSDASKPISTATQTALDGKAAVSHEHSAAAITSGTLATARLGSGTASNTTFLRGDSAYAPLGEVFEFTRTTAPSGATGNNGPWAWTLPATARAVRFECIAGGGGGGSGRRFAAGNQRFGGGGGSGGGRGEVTFPAALLTSRDLIIGVGAGGAGGAAQETDDSNGSAGTAGGASYARYASLGTGSNQNLCVATAGGAGAAGTGANGTGGSNFAQFPGSAGGASSTSATAASGAEAANASSGGGGGGGIDSTNNARNGGAGGRISPFSNTIFGSTGGTAPGGNGGDPLVYGFLGHGGAGGAGHASGAGGNGSSGAFPGGGGGGGGGAVNGFASGAGGNGADGIVRITVWY